MTEHLATRLEQVVRSLRAERDERLDRGADQVLSVQVDCGRCARRYRQPGSGAGTRTPALAVRLDRERRSRLLGTGSVHGPGSLARLAESVVAEVVSARIWTGPLFIASHGRREANPCPLAGYARSARRTPVVCHCFPPAAVGTPSAFSSSAIAGRVIPLLRRILTRDAVSGASERGRPNRAPCDFFTAIASFVR